MDGWGHLVRAESATEEKHRGAGPFDDRGQHTDPRQLLTVAVAAEYLTMSRGAVYNLLRCGELRSIHIGRSRRIVLGDLWSFVDQRTVGV